MRAKFITVASYLLLILGAFALLARPLQAQTVSEFVAEHPDVSTFFTLANATLLREAETLVTSHTLVTVFAPDNEAFRRLPARVTRKLHQNHTLLNDVLLYHVTLGNLTKSELIARRRFSAHTLYDNQTILIRASSRVITVNGRRVVKPGFPFDLGTVYTIDGVLVPPSLAREILG